MLEPARMQFRRLQRTLRRVASRSRTLKQGYHWLRGRGRKIPQGISGSRERSQGKYTRDAGVRPENIIWIFGSGRSGSTWLRSMMEELDRHHLWEEPMVGKLFGEFRDRSMEAELHRPDFIMSDATRKGWIRAIRNFVLDCASYAH